MSGKSGRSRNGRGAWIVALFLGSLSETGFASAQDESDPCWRLETVAGAITVRFARAAAPAAVAAIDALVRGSMAGAAGDSPAQFAHQGEAFAGSGFHYARPKLEVRLSAGARAQPRVVPAELDARALGLDRQRVADAGEAMNKLQFELLPALYRPGAERRATPRLEAWARSFEIDHDPTFLVGSSRQELLEAVGYEFREGFATLPATRGAVALVPVSPTEAELTLAFLLADHPLRSGRWVVVGRVVSGLEVVDAIAARPLAQVEQRDYRPLRPVTVDQALLFATCPDALEGGTR